MDKKVYTEQIIEGLVGAGEIAENLNAIQDAVLEATEKTGLATEETAGIVKQAANVAGAAGANPTAAEFKALLDALIEAGIMAEADED